MDQVVLKLHIQKINENPQFIDHYMSIFMYIYIYICMVSDIPIISMMLEQSTIYKSLACGKPNDKPQYYHHLGCINHPHHLQDVFRCRLSIALIFFLRPRDTVV